MIDVSIKLKNKSYTSDEIGNQIEIETLKEVPIIKIGSVYANEFYQASQVGLKPTLQITISALNYENENELIYQDVVYSIIRVDSKNVDEIILVCQKRVGD